MGDLNLARVDFSKAMELKPSNPILECDYYHARGRLQFETGGTFSLILDEYNKAIALQLHNPILYLDRGTLYLKENSETDAINDFSMWIKLNFGENINVLYED